MRRWITAFSMIALGAQVALALATPACAQNTVRMAVPSVNLSNSSIYVADELGYFKQMNVQLNVTVATSGPAAISGAMNGDIDVVSAAVGNILGARRAGGDIVAFGALGTQFGVNVVVTRKWADQHRLTVASSYKDKLAALKGSTMVISVAGGVNEQLLRYLAEEGGLNADRDITMVTIGDTGAMLAAFSQNRVDGLSVSSPTSPAAAHDLNGLMLFNSTRGELPALNGYFGSGVAASRAWLMKNPALAARFIAAMQMGFDALHDPARTNQARDAVRQAKFPQMNQGLFAVLWEDQVKGSPKGPDISREMVQRVIDFNNRFTKDKMEYSQIDGSFTNEYLERARRELKK